MQTTRKGKNIILAANVLSIVFSPLFVPIYGMIMALTMTPLSVLPTSTRLISLGVVATFTGILPLFLLYLMKRSGRISDIDITQRGQRTRPLIMMLICYTLTLFYVIGAHAPLWLILYFASGLVTAIILGIITIAVKWKISMHGAGMGNLAGFLAAIGMLGLGGESTMIWLSITIICAGMVGSARVILEKHTLMQVFCGFTISALVTYFMMISPY